MKTDWLIIGAGPAGLSAAYELTRHGERPLVVEADPRHLGGLSRTQNHGGYRFDIGGHRFFSKNAEIEALWKSLLGDDLLEVSRLSRIYYRGRFFDYPLRLGNALANLGVLDSVVCLASYLWARLFPRSPVHSFEDWVVNAFGQRLYSIFFKSYTEKVWGMPCHEIGADWAAQRIRGLDLGRALLDAVRKQRGDAVIKTLTDRFRYPRLGPGQMWEALGRRVEAGGGQIKLGFRVEEIVALEGRLERVHLDTPAGPVVVEPRTVISSMPVQSLVSCLRPAPPETVLEAARGLRYRDFLSVLLIVDQEDVFPDNWIYIHDPRVKLGRVQNFKNWSRAMVSEPGATALGLEYFCFVGDELWSLSDDELVRLGIEEAARVGLIEPHTVRDGSVVRAPCAYPVYDAGYRDRVETIRSYLHTSLPDLHLIGRNGMHRYFNQDHAMWTGFQVVRNLLTGARSDPWQTNADEEFLEEERLTPEARVR